MSTAVCSDLCSGTKKLHDNQGPTEMITKSGVWDQVWLIDKNCYYHSVGQKTPKGVMRRRNYHTVFTLTVILHVMWTLRALFSLSKMVLLSIDPVQGNFFPGVHSSISVSYTAAGRQEENSTAVKIVCIEEMVNKNKTAEKQWNWKHPQTDVNVSGKCAQSKIQCFCSCLFKFLDYFLKTVACCSNHKGNIGWMFSLIKAVSHTQKYFFFFFCGGPKRKYSNSLTHKVLPFYVLNLTTHSAD